MAGQRTYSIYEGVTQKSAQDMHKSVIPQTKLKQIIL